MNRKTRENEIRALSHIMLVITITVFTAVLSVLNVLLDWEKWTLPVFGSAVILSLFMHIIQKPEEKARLYIYGIIFIVEIFYYAVNIDTVYDSTPVIVLALIIFALTQERMLSRACFVVGYLGIIFNLNMNEHPNMQPSDMVRTIWHFIIVAIAAGVVECYFASTKRKEKLYEEKLSALEAENKSAGDFLANVSHEIRTPINAVIGLSKVSIEGSRESETIKNMRSVEEAGKRVAAQISDILDYSEIDMNKVSVNCEDYMLSSALNDLCMELGPYLRQELELIIDVETTVPSVMYSDVAKIKRILWHLILNGLKYTESGGVYVHIDSVPQNYGVNLCIEVRDTGEGMDEEELEHVFDRFYQGDSGRTRSSNGLGLGLSIVSGFVKALDGFCFIDSKKGKGTTVKVSIPQEVKDSAGCMSVRRSDLMLGGYLHFDKFDNPEVRDFYDSMIRHMVMGLGVQMHRVDNLADCRELVKNLSFSHLFVGEEEYATDPEYFEKIAWKLVLVIVAKPDFTLPEGSNAKILKKPFYCFPVVNILNSSDGNVNIYERFTLPGVRALVVDDEPMNLMVARSVFGRYEMIIDTANSGFEAIEKCGSQDYDLVFMDHMMPKMDGVEAMKRIRSLSDRARKELPIIALTANAVSSAKEMFLSEGFDGFVAKPVDLAELERVLKRVLPKNLFKAEAEEEKTEKNDGTGNYHKSSSNGVENNPTADKNDSTKRQETESNEPANQQDKPKDLLETLATLGVTTATGLEFCQGDEEFYNELFAAVCR